LGEAGLLHRDALTVSGRTIWEDVAAAENYDTRVIRTSEEALTAEGGVMVVRGNLAPNGAVLKPSAATPALMQHTGRAVVFQNIEDYHQRINDDALDIDETCVMVLKNCGPRGYPGMAEVGNMGLPPKILKKGITDMVRISDARMSGTAYGTVVLHAAPEAAVGGPLALVENGDMITLDAAGRLLTLHVDEAAMAERRKAWVVPPPPMLSGYQKLYVDHVLQADRGCDMDFLVGRRGADVPRHSH
jgi:dihydroxy-acid dehydratase